MLTKIAAFIIAMLILVGLHEFGHYIVARWCGIKVQRFSVGFGKPFFKRKRGDTEWCLAPIPLGGYVKMVDTRSGDVSEADLPYAFDKQHPLKRIAVVAAGPLTNLILAAVLFSFSFSLGGVTELRPYVGAVESASIAERAGFMAGDKIVAVNHVTVNNWSEVHREIVLNFESKKVAVAVQTEDGQNLVRTIDIANTPEAEQVVKQHGYIGLLRHKISNTLGKVLPDSPAASAGLQKGDTLLTADGKQLNGREWWTLFGQNPGKNLNIQYLREGETFETKLRPESKESADGTLIGRAGIALQRDKAWAEKIIHHYTPTFFQALRLGWREMVDNSVLIVKFLGKMFTKQMSTSHISGPLTMADIAGETASYGLQSYVEFLAFFSVSLGIMNLLPIPILDGGHLVYYFVEWIRGKPLSKRIQSVGQVLGVVMLFMLMGVAFFNDITRFFG